MFSSLMLKRRSWKCPNHELASLRQEGIQGWDQKNLSRARWLFVGAGGNGYVVEGVAKKGMGEIQICDKDIVTQSNLNRQKFNACDLYKPKAERLAKSISRCASLGSVLIPHVAWFQELDLDALKPEGIVCAVDPSIPGTRLDVSKACARLAIPAVFWAVSTDADWGWVFVQEPGRACLGCAFPPTIASDKGSTERCPGTPASCDVLMAIASLALYAVDTIVMERLRDWNFRSLSLSKSDFGGGRFIDPMPECDCRRSSDGG